MALTPQPGVAQVHARLANSPRAVADPASAELFHIPFYSWQIGHAQGFRAYRKCGINFAEHGDAATELWQWLLKQKSFQQSDCSDHFIVLAEVSDAVHVVRFRHKRSQSYSMRVMHPV